MELNQPLSSLRHWSPKGDSAQRLGRQTKAANGDPAPSGDVFDDVKNLLIPPAALLLTEPSDLLFERTHTLLRQQIYLGVDDTKCSLGDSFCSMP